MMRNAREESANKAFDSISRAMPPAEPGASLANAPIPTSRKAALAWQRLNGVSSSRCPAARQFDPETMSSPLPRDYCETRSNTTT